MIRLNPTKPNDGKEYDAIFKERVSHGVDALDLRRWRTLIRRHRGGTTLEIGCGDSGIPDLLSNIFHYGMSMYTGVDVSTHTIAEMKKRHPTSKKTTMGFEVADAYTLPFSDRTFDYAILGEVLEHLERPNDAIAEAMRVLKEGGVLAVSVPLNEATEPGAVDGNHHIWSFSKEDIVRMLSPYGRVKTKVLRSQWFPKYRYQWPVLVAWCFKK